MQTQFAPRLRPRLVGALLLLTLALALVGVGRLAAHATGSTITLSATTGKPGQLIRVHGQGFTKGELIDLTLGATSLGSTYGALNGTFTTKFTVPVVQPNTYTVSATGVSNQEVATANFTIPVFTTIKLGPSSALTGNRVTVQGHGFAAQESVTVSFNNVVVGQAETATDGTVVISFIVPSSTQPGSYSVTATGQSSTLSASATLLVAVGPNWSEYGYTPQNTRFNTQETILSTTNVSTLKKKWKFATGDIIESSAAVVNGIVYFGSDDGNIYAIKANSGAKLWSFTTGSVVRASSPAVVNGVVYVGSYDTKLYALDASTGAKLWSFATFSGIFSSPAVVNGVVYFGSGDTNVYALDASTGAKLWSFATGNFVASSPAVANGVVYVGSNDNNVYALNASTGAQLWSFATGGIVQSSPAVANGVVYVGSDDNNLYALDASTGAKLWSFATGNSVESSPAVANGVVYFGSDDNNLYALNASTGAKLWSFTAGSIVYDSPAVANGVVYFGSEDRNLYALDASSGTKLFSFATGNSVFASPAVANGVVYVGSDDNNLYAFGL